MTIIQGNTYPHRTAIKENGFRWHKITKTWQRELPLTPDEEAKFLVLRGIYIVGASGVTLDTRTHKQIYGRCEDAPCCGCCGIY